MRRSPRQYDVEFKRRAVQMILDGRPRLEAARNLDVPESYLRRWKKDLLGELDNQSAPCQPSASELAAENAKLHRGLSHSKRRVARLLRERGLKGRRRGKYKSITTHSEHQYVYSKNLLKQAMQETSSPMPETWVCDTTYIATDDGWAYLAVTMTLSSRYMLGWSLSRNKDTELCLSSLQKALGVRQPPNGFIVHRDRGSTYASDAFQDALRQAGALSSMSAKGNCYDNAAMESFFGTLKAECTFHLPYRDIEQATQSIFSYIEALYNNRRLRSGIGYAPPVEVYRAMAA